MPYSRIQAAGLTVSELQGIIEDRLEGPVGRVTVTPIDRP